MEWFQEGGDGFNNVLAVLCTFTLYDQTCGYVQGMNFVVASLVYHASPEVVFWLLTTLFESFQLRKNYIEGFNGFYE